MCYQVESHTMLNYENYHAAPAESWGSDLLIVPTHNTRNTQSGLTNGQKSKMPTWLWLSISIILAVIMLIVAAVVISRMTNTTNENVEVPPKLMADLPPQLSDNLASCYADDSFLSLFDLSGEVPRCIIQPEPKEESAMIVYYLDATEQVTAVAKPHNYLDSRDLSEHATTAEKLILHSASGASSFYAVNVTAADQAFVLFITNTTEAELNKKLKRYDLITSEALAA